MATDKDVYQIDTAQAVDALKQLINSVQGVEKQTKQTKEEVKGLGDYMRDEFKDNFMSAQAGYDAFKGALHATTEFIKEGVDGYLRNEQAVARLGAALNAAGAESNVYRDALVAQAGAIERVTGMDEEHIQSIQALLAQMGVAPGQIERMTNAALRLAAATGQDGVAAARLLAQAQAQGKDELRKYNIEVDEATFAARGYAAVLEQVERRFPPLNQQIPETVQNINNLKGAWDDFGKSVGSLIVRMTTFGQSNIFATVLDNWSGMLDQMDARTAKSMASWGAILGPGGALLAFGADMRAKLEEETQAAENNSAAFEERANAYRINAEQLRTLEESLRTASAVAKAADWGTPQYFSAKGAVEQLTAQVDKLKQATKEAADQGNALRTSPSQEKLDPLGLDGEQKRAATARANQAAEEERKRLEEEEKKKKELLAKAAREREEAEKRAAEQRRQRKLKEAADEKAALKKMAEEELDEVIKKNQKKEEEDRKAAQKEVDLNRKVQEEIFQINKQRYEQKVAIDQIQLAGVREMFRAEAESRQLTHEQAINQANQLKEHWQGVVSDLQGYAAQMLNGFAQLFQQALTSNTRYNAEMEELRMKRETAGMSEAEAAKKRAEMEKKMSQERAAAVLKMTAEVLAQISAQAAVKAVWEAAEAIAAAARYEYAAAAQHGAAAAIYATVAGVAGGTSAAISAARPMTREEQEQIDAEKKAQERKQDVGDKGGQTAVADAQATAATVVNVNYIGISGMTTVQQGEELARIQKEYANMATGGG